MSSVERKNSAEREKVPPQQDSAANQTIIEEKSYKQNGVVKRYLKGRFLGKGGFAKCYEFTSLETKKIFAAKVIVKSSLTKNRAKQKLMSEIKIHKSLRHNHVVNCEHFFEDSENVYILLEICTNQTMNELIRRRKRLTDIEVQCYLLQILSALKYLHTNRVIHRDLKLGNLFLSDKMEIKLGDFGLATKLEFDGEKKKTICGTPNYIAPEILEGKKGHSYEVDVWSLGVIIYTLLIGKPPFETSDVKTTYKRIRMNAYTFPEHLTIHPAAKSLITSILQTDPEKRPTIDEILAHEYLCNTKSIPSHLPVSTLACPPPSSFLKQYGSAIKETGNENIPITKTLNVSEKKVTESTSPIVSKNMRQSLKEKKDFVNTERVGLISAEYNFKKTEYDYNNVNNAKIPKEGSNKKESSIGEAINMNEISQKRKYEGLTSNRNSLGGSLGNMVNSLPSNPLRMSRENIDLKGTPTTELKGTDIWVKKWADYSTKYGLGYILSNGAFGVYFNDSTKIICRAKDGKFNYIERKGPERQDVINTYTINEYPKEIQKKVTLYHHFKNYLTGEDNKTVRDAIDFTSIFPNHSLDIYVKKWMKTPHAILFRLSNKVVQVVFQDDTQIILSSESRVVTYVNKKHERINYPLSSALESENHEMVKRLKYTKEILTKMLGGNGNQAIGSGATPIVTGSSTPSNEPSVKKNSGSIVLTSNTNSSKDYNTSYGASSSTNVAKKGFSTGISGSNYYSSQSINSKLKEEAESPFDSKFHLMKSTSPITRMSSGHNFNTDPSKINNYTSGSRTEF